MSDKIQSIQHSNNHKNTNHKPPIGGWAPFLELEHGTEAKPCNSKGVRVVSWNMNGARARLKRSDLLSEIRKSNADIFCAQEFRCPLYVFLRRPGVKELLSEMGYSYIAYHMSTSNVGYAGVAIFSRVRFTKFGEGVDDASLDTEGRVVWAEFEKFRLYNIYAPNSGSIGNLVNMPKKLRFMKALSKCVSNVCKPVMLCGDFNVTRLQNDVYDSLSHPRWTDHPSCTTTERDMFAELMAQSDLIDVQQKFNVHGFTFFRSRYLAAQNKGMRLDYFLCTEDFRRQNILRMELLNTTAGSDHVPLCSDP